MSTWVLLVAMYAGAWSASDSTALTAIHGFINKEECIMAGRTSIDLARGTKKEVSFICLFRTNTTGKSK